MARTIERSSQFKKDYKREIKGIYRIMLNDSLQNILNILVNDLPIPEKYADHPLKGNWRTFRDCHLYPDLILIYKKEGDCCLKLARLGSHSEIF
ncbi:type II toxin-antitoxin system YafQ family toxin [Morganella morganii]|uniref:type II toxin-antitoxin system YafQ family toxin n=1 Tax=Morganella morganii TaxID=582 RepID=UPI001F3E7643|nr:type II toxin-antitoxin system YafQ family toxin [Morganella morganii]MCF1264202.1 type II toxin-antitoxin system YafQ family toxin [Morganella morganii]